jgi:hypothetical protein
MKRIIRQLLAVGSVVGGLLLLSACSSTPDTYANVDPAADFSVYKTYGFVDNPASNKQEYESLETSFLKVAVAQQMDARGYSYAKAPDLLLNFYIHREEKVQTYNTPAAHGYYGYRNYNSWGGYAYETQVQQYTEGTLNIDVVDASTNKLVWEGVLTGRLTDKDVANFEATVDAAVKDIFANSPG